MKPRTIFIGILLFIIFVFKSYAQLNDFPVLKGLYIGQKPPGMTPEVFAPGVVSTASHEFSCSFTPDGNEFYFTRRNPKLKKLLIMVTKLRDGVWTEPEVVPFVENQFSFEPMVTPDNRRIYFSSGVPIPGQLGPPMNILYVEREGDGWSMPKNPGSPFNPAKTMLISSTLDGTIYTTDISEGPGTGYIAVIKKIKGEFQKLERLGHPINGKTQNMYPFIAPDESYLIFTSLRPSEKIDSVLLISFKNPDKSWSEPKEIDLGMNAGLPFVSRDGRFLFFTAGERIKSDIYWVDAKIIEELRKE